MPIHSLWLHSDFFYILYIFYVLYTVYIIIFLKQEEILNKKINNRHDMYLFDVSLTTPYKHSADFLLLLFTGSVMYYENKSNNQGLQWARHVNDLKLHTIYVAVMQLENKCNYETAKICSRAFLGQSGSYVLGKTKNDW